MSSRAVTYVSQMSRPVVARRAAGGGGQIVAHSSIHSVVNSFIHNTAAATYNAQPHPTATAMPRAHHKPGTTATTRKLRVVRTAAYVALVRHLVGSLADRSRKAALAEARDLGGGIEQAQAGREQAVKAASRRRTPTHQRKRESVASLGRRLQQLLSTNRTIVGKTTRSTHAPTHPRTHPPSAHPPWTTSRPCSAPGGA
jgi:hypothetical protein